MKFFHGYFFKIRDSLIFILCLFFLFHSHELDAGGFKAKKIQAVQIKERIHVDGVLDEASWQLKGFTGFIQSEPLDGEPATERTVVWVGYDSDHLYVAARLYDSEPEKIITRLGRRDDELESDWFIFAIDPYFDKRSGFQFEVNPSGSIRDGTL